jgi:hypothetical protein
MYWNKARVLQTEPNFIYKKYRELAHMSVVGNPISQLCLDLSPIWIRVIKEEVGKFLSSSV